MNNDFINQRPSAVRRLFLAAAGVTSAATLHAHPGHGLLEEGARHTLTSPYHLTVLALIGVSLFAGAHFTRQRIPRRALRSIGVVAIALSAVLWGLRI
jgi:hypothetical protein